MAKTLTLDVQSFSQRTIQAGYPYFKLREMSQVTPSVVKLLEEGDIHLRGAYNGKEVVVMRISKSAYNVWRLIRTHGSLTYCVSPEESFLIEDVEQYLEIIAKEASYGFDSNPITSSGSGDSTYEEIRNNISG